MIQFALLLGVGIGYLFAFPDQETPVGQIEESELKQKIPSVLWSTLDGRMSVVAPGESEIQQKLGPVVHVEYPRGRWGSKESGAQFLVKVPSAKRYTCEYFVRFAKDFDFVRGGKLPGLAGGTATSGLNRPTGDGWTARYMWRERGDAVLYLYHVGQAGLQGDDISLSTRFIRGRWYHLKQIVRVNDVERSNGSVDVWVDGQHVLGRQDLRLQTGGQAPVDRFYFSTFFGGSGKEWAPPRDTAIDFARIRVYTTEENEER